MRDRTVDASPQSSPRHFPRYTLRKRQIRRVPEGASPGELIERGQRQPRASHMANVPTLQVVSCRIGRWAIVLFAVFREAFLRCQAVRSRGSLAEEFLEADGFIFFDGSRRVLRPPRGSQPSQSSNSSAIYPGETKCSSPASLPDRLTRGCVGSDGPSSSFSFKSPGLWLLHAGPCSINGAFSIAVCHSTSRELSCSVLASYSQRIVFPTRQ